MHLVPREHRATKLIELDACFFDNFTRLFVKPDKKKKKKKGRKAKMAKKEAPKKGKPAKKTPKVKVAKKTAAATLTKKASSVLKKALSDEPVLSRQDTKKRDALARTGATTHKWQFTNDKGKWSDYEKSASDLVEMAYASWQINNEVDVRAVHSGDWDYQVDFNKMTQQNVRHPNHRVRRIQRIPRL